MTSSSKKEWPEVAIALRENRRELVVSNHGVFDPRVYNLTQLNFLDVSKCSMNEIAEEVSNLLDLAKLSLQYDEITAVPVSLGRLKHLKFLNLSYNSISNLPPDIFNQLSVLETLILNSNQLSELPSLEGLIDLHILSATNNKLKNIPASLVACTKLKEVDFSSNEIGELSNQMSWCQLSNIQHFHLNDNQIKEVPSSLVECKKLRDLQLKGNPLKDSRLKKLAMSQRTADGNAIMAYLAKIAKERGKQAPVSKSSENPQKVAEKQTSYKNTEIHLKIESDNSEFRIDVLRPTEVKCGLRPRIFGCIVSGVGFKNEEAIHNFVKYQTKLHGQVCDQRRLGTISTHDATNLKLPLQFSMQNIDVIYFRPLNAKKAHTGREFLANLQRNAEMERKQRKMNTYSGIMQYLTLISPLLGPHQSPISANKGAEIQPLPVTTDSSGNTISVHPISGCEKTRLSVDTRAIVLEVAGVNDALCKEVMQKLLEWLLEKAVVPTEEGDGGSVTITPLAVVNAETGDRFAKFPLEKDLRDFGFLNLQVAM